MLLTFLLLCVACTFVITVLYDQFNEPESLIFWIPLYLDNILIKFNAHWLSKPLYGCMICMSSFWGGLYFWVLSRLFAPDFGLFHILCAIPVIGGMLTIVSAFKFMKEIGEDNGEPFI